jgi:hypothetical protein
MVYVVKYRVSYDEDKEEERTARFLPGEIEQWKQDCYPWWDVMDCAKEAITEQLNDEFPDGCHWELV